MKTQSGLIPVERIANAIYFIRGEKVMLDRDLAALYGVETKMLKRAVRRNLDRFPEVRPNSKIGGANLAPPMKIVWDFVTHRWRSLNTAF